MTVSLSLSDPPRTLPTMGPSECEVLVDGVWTPGWLLTRYGSDATGWSVIVRVLRPGERVTTATVTDDQIRPRKES